MSPSKLIVITHSAISGNGSFAATDIPCGTHLITLAGKPIVKHLALQSNDPLQIDENTYLDLNHESKTINHSCAPNCGMRNRSDLYAIRDIKQGEEITYDYSTTVGSDDHFFAMPCACGAMDCRRVIGNFLSIPKARLIDYAALNALPQFIRDELLVMTNEVVWQTS